MSEHMFLIYAVTKLYSRIVLNKLSPSACQIYRNVERNFKKSMKTKADIKYLQFCASNQLLPKFTNFRLYDVSAHNEPSTIGFRKGLIEREIKKK